MLVKYLILSAIIFTICSGVFIFMINKSVNDYLDDQFPSPKDLNYPENDK